MRDVPASRSCLTHSPEIGIRCVNECEVDFLQMLLHVRKDKPRDIVHDLYKVIDVQNRALRMSIERPKGSQQRTASWQ